MTLNQKVIKEKETLVIDHPQGRIADLQREMVDRNVGTDNAEREISKQKLKA